MTSAEIYLEILKNYSDKELVKISQELIMDTIPEDSLCLKIVRQFYGYNVGVNDVPKILTLAIPLSFELGKRLLNENPSSFVAPFSKEQVENLNTFQQLGNTHPFTCPNDGDERHIAYEFEKTHTGENYDEFIKSEKLNGIPYPEMAFNQTSLVATEEGWKCPVCDYKQNWAHSFMSDLK